MPNVKNFMPVPSIKKATTTPPKVIALKFNLARTAANDADDFDDEFINLGITYDTNNAAARSSAEQYHIRVKDMDSGEEKSYIQYADRVPYKYWQRSIEAEDPDTDTEVQGGIVNGSVTITPLNDFGAGLRSRFILPLRDMNYIGNFNNQNSKTFLVLAKYWELFSRSPEMIYNRPKVMHIYVDVPQQDIKDDKEYLSQDMWAQDTIGDWKETNQQLFRWSIQDDGLYKLDTYDEFIEMTQDEQEYIRLLIESFSTVYQEYLNRQGFDQGDPHIFKLGVKNPADHDDTIIIYLMKGMKWQL